MKLHIDTDIGSNIDDLCALALALAWTGVELTGVTTVAEHGGKRAGYAKYALGVAGHDDIDVVAGADVALNCYRNLPHLLDELTYWPEPIAPAPANLDAALDLIQGSIEKGATIVALGPCTNLALLERRSPGVLRDAQLFVMGGFVFPPRPGFPPFDFRRDTNIQIDVRSAYDVLRASRPTLVPISVTVEALLRRTDLPVLRAGGPLARLIARQAAAFAQEKGYERHYGETCAALPRDVIAFHHDPLTCAIALGWQTGVEIRELPMKLDIVDGWLHQTIDERGRPMRVVTRVDGPRFSEFWVNTITESNAR